jgi:rhomboid family GlyGly-CTERM serine protease
MGTVSFKQRNTSAKWRAGCVSFPIGREQIIFRPCDWLPIGLVAVACLVAASSALTTALEFDQAAIAAGQVWRIVTGHLTHWNLDHLFWDAAVFVGLGVVCARRSTVRTVICLLGSAIAISFSLLVWCPEVLIYRGLSGVDSALFALLAVGLLQDGHRSQDRMLQSVAAALLLAFFGKTAFEVLTGTTLFVDSEAAGFQPIALAHAVGGAVGALAAIFPRQPPRDE